MGLVSSDPDIHMTEEVGPAADVDSRISIIEVSSREALGSAFDAGLCALYAEVFGEPPEFQQWSADEVKRLFSAYFERGRVVLAVCASSSRCIGFVATTPLVNASLFGQSAMATGPTPHVVLDSAFFAARDIDASTAQYVADLGVAAGFRRRGLASRLLHAATTLVQPVLPRSHVLLRVSAVKDFALQLYERAGFVLLEGVRQEVPFRVSGIEAPVLLTKLLMVKSLSV
jgi:ribosomal protein S18 acetylase RimI-like enzyme